LSRLDIKKDGDRRLPVYGETREEIGFRRNGAKRIRTADPLHAMQVLYQLSYSPECLSIFSCGGGFVKRFLAFFDIFRQKTSDKLPIAVKSLASRFQGQFVQGMGPGLSE
jgi:hypothetical protein